jgi:NADH-quinone oxidoreductase subunit G
LRALSDVLGKTLAYDNLGELRQQLIQGNPVFAAVDQIQPAAWGAFGEAGTVDPAPLVSPIRNYYMTDPISRASETMALCTAALIDRNQGEATGTDG